MMNLLVSAKHSKIMCLAETSAGSVSGTICLFRNKSEYLKSCFCQRQLRSIQWI